MLKNNVSKMVVASLAVLPLCGFSMDGLTDAASSLASSTTSEAQSATVDVNTLSAQGAKLVASYALAMSGVTEAQSDLAKAFNLNDLATELDAQQTALKSGNLTSDEAEKVVELSEKANNLLEEKMNEKTELDAQAKEQVGSALLKYSAGTAGTAMLIKSAKDMVTDTGSYIAALPWSQKANALSGDLTAALNIAKEIPSLSANLISTGNSFVKYATSQGIDVSGAEKEMSKAAGF